MDMEKLNYEIFSILENKFLFDSFSPPQTPVKCCSGNISKTPNSKHFSYGGGGKIRILSIDAAEDVLPTAAAIARLESNLRSVSGLPTATIADFFDAAAGSGDGGVLATMLFTKKSSDGKPLFSAEEAFAFLTKNKLFKNENSGLMGLFSKKNNNRKLRKIFKNEETLRDTIKPFLIPCYDLVTGSPFVFSRSDAVESDGYDFKMSDVCAATCAVRTVGTKSVNGRSKIDALGNGAVMSNPTAAVITHVLNNKTELPYVNGVEDLVVVSFGNGSVHESSAATATRKKMGRITANLMAETVDEAVAMAFGSNASSNYVRIQSNNMNNSVKSLSDVDMLAQCNVESVMFSGKRISKLSNAGKLHLFAKKIVEEEERRKTSPIPMVMIKQHATMTPPRSSTSTIMSLSSSSSSTDSC